MHLQLLNRLRGDGDLVGDRDALLRVKVHVDAPHVVAVERRLARARAAARGDARDGAARRGDEERGDEQVVVAALRGAVADDVRGGHGGLLLREGVRQRGRHAVGHGAVGVLHRPGDLGAHVQVPGHLCPGVVVHVDAELRLGGVVRQGARDVHAAHGGLDGLVSRPEQDAPLVGVAADHVEQLPQVEGAQVAHDAVGDQAGHLGEEGVLVFGVEPPVDVAREDLRRVGAVDDGAVARGDAAHQGQDVLHEHRVHGDDAVDRLAHVGLPRLGHQARGAREVGRAVEVAGADAHVRPEQGDLLVGELEGDVALARDGGEAAQGGLAVLDGDGAPRAGEPARGAGLGVALRDDEVGARPVAADDLGDLRDEGAVGVEQLARLGERLPELVDHVVELRDLEGAERLQARRGVVDRRLDLGDEAAVLRERGGVHARARQQRVERVGGQGRRCRLERAADQGVGDREQLAGALDVAAVAGDVGGQVPDGAVELLPQGVDALPQVGRGLLERRAVAVLDGRLQVVDGRGERARPVQGALHRAVCHGADHGDRRDERDDDAEDDEQGRLAALASGRAAGAAAARGAAGPAGRRAEAVALARVGVGVVRTARVGAAVVGAGAVWHVPSRVRSSMVVWPCMVVVHPPCAVSGARDGPAPRRCSRCAPT